jgi:hypothetical protein
MRRTTLLNLCLLSLAVVALVVACTAPQTSGDVPSQASPEERTARLPEAATSPTTDPTPSEPVATVASATAAPGIAAATTVVDPTQPLSVTILNTNDVYGKTDPCG